jgi:glycosyltransferase involved in cell wall biosynthesis
MAFSIALIEPYYGGSHRAWADEYRRYSTHDIHLLTLPAQFWKWRMQGGAVTIARLFTQQRLAPDVILVSDMFNLATFCALTRSTTHATPTALYFHENQLTYPQNSRQRHGWQYGFTNYISALTADAVYFNSAFHRDSFLDMLPRMLRHFGDHNELETVDVLRHKSQVLPLGIDLRRYDACPAARDPDAPPLIVWNHRWEEDKNPAAFFRALRGLVKRDVPFRVALVGENFRQQPVEFEQARVWLGDRVVAYGYVPGFADYARLLKSADYVVSTAYQDFFGVAVAEAIYCGCVPLLPKRLNYPALIPADHHDRCLYPGDNLLPMLLRHLRDDQQVDRAALRQHVAAYDWSRMAGVYDSALSQLARPQGH